ncbi:MAG: hypothetical protein ACM3VT_19165 [Solirubrobacterales bacterium]
MRYGQDKTIDCRGTTLVELTVAVAVMAVVFAAIMPLFAGMRNSADARWASLEMVQNARVLNEQLCRYLAAAKRITAVSAESSDSGTIEFEAADGTSYRCALETDGRVVFGPIGELSELAGPVSSLRFVCYDGNDLIDATTTPEEVRLVTWQARLQSEGTLTHDKTLSGTCYLRVAGTNGADETGPVVTYDFATRTPGTDCFAFADEGKPQVPDTPTTPDQLIESDLYAAMAVDDARSHALKAFSDADWAQVRVMFQIEQEPAHVARITATWIGTGVNGHSFSMDGAALYLWNYRSSQYELIQISPNTEAEVTLRGSGAAAASQYLGGAGGKTVVLLVVSNEKMLGNKRDMLSTDYVKIDVTTAGGAEAFAP